MFQTPKGDATQGPTDEEDIEILEIVGLDAPEEPGEEEEEPEESPGEIEVLFEGDAEETAAPARSRPAPAAPAATPPEAETRERFLRLQADFDNFRKRIEREREEYTECATRALVERLLVVLDNFERALAARGATGDDTFKDGVSLIHRQLYDELCKEGLAAVDAVGEAFDPALHEAVATDESSSLPANTIVEELRRGYYFRGRLLRPALVRVVVSRETGDSWEPGGKER